MKIYKLASILFFLGITGLQEHGVPNFALIIVYVLQFFIDLINNGQLFYWGILHILTVPLLIWYYVNNTYWISVACALVLTMGIIYFTGLPENPDKVDSTYVFMFSGFVITSVLASVNDKKRSHPQEYAQGNESVF